MDKIINFGMLTIDPLHIRPCHSTSPSRRIINYTNTPGCVLFLAVLWILKEKSWLYWKCILNTWVIIITIPNHIKKWSEKTRDKHWRYCCARVCVCVCIFISVGKRERKRKKCTCYTENNRNMASSVSVGSRGAWCCISRTVLVGVFAFYASNLS